MGHITSNEDKAQGRPDAPGPASPWEPVPWPVGSGAEKQGPRGPQGGRDTSTGTETKGERHTETKAGDVCVGRDKNSERDGQKRRDRKRGEERVRDEG